jgi:hypothetical protein
VKIFLLLLAAALIAGCSHGQVQYSGGAVSTSSGGTAVNSSSAGLNVQGGGATAAALIGLGIAGAVIYRSENSAYGTRYNSNPFMAITGSDRAPELAPLRKVNEQDCTRPIEDSSANLKCR